MIVKENLFDYNSAQQYQIIQGDAFSVLSEIENDKFNSIITSPHHNV